LARNVFRCGFVSNSCPHSIEDSIFFSKYGYATILPSFWVEGCPGFHCAHGFTGNGPGSERKISGAALEASTLTTGYKLSQDRLKIHSMTINTGITGDGWGWGFEREVGGSLRQAAR
jgi:hypothetical protein